MKSKYTLAFFFLFCIIYSFTNIYAQEGILPLRENRNLRLLKKSNAPVALARPTSISLPFFDDFAYYTAYPKQTLWADSGTYVNNTMAVKPPTWGVATFDALDKNGIPYDTTDAYDWGISDKLTSLPIDLSSYSSSDSLYLSFRYEAQGLGFSPKPQDSLIVQFLKPTGAWESQWAVVVNDTNTDSFVTAMIPITDTAFFKENFQFRIANYATLGISNSNWHVDYVKLDKNRTINDTAIKEVSVLNGANSLLNDFTVMPFSHFATNPTDFLNATNNALFNNTSNSTTNLAVGYTSKQVGNTTNISTGSANQLIPSFDTFSHSFNSFLLNNLSNTDQNIDIATTYHCSSLYTNESKTNDTFTAHQYFNNTFGYDDGSAESIYFVNQYSSAPSYIAVEYALYKSDTISGFEIYLPQTVPGQEEKIFYAQIYKSIAYDGGTDNLLYSEQDLYPAYTDSVNKMTVYKFTTPQVLDTGVFYLSIMQIAGGISDSLYIGLDRNRVGGNHRYYKSGATWESSLIDGALLFRPVIGTNIHATSTNNIQKETQNWTIYPNPVNKGNIYLSTNGTNLGKQAQYKLITISGEEIKAGALHSGINTITIPPVANGIYFMQYSNDGVIFDHKKIIIIQ